MSEANGRGRPTRHRQNMNHLLTRGSRVELLRLHQVRVLLALKSSTRPLTIEEITMATALDTPNGIPIGEPLVRRALRGESAGGPNSHESTGFTGLLDRGFVTKEGIDTDSAFPTLAPAAVAREARLRSRHPKFLLKDSNILAVSTGFPAWASRIETPARPRCGPAHPTRLPPRTSRRR